ncbi:hypothetical protein SAMN05216222_2515 [Pseudomonas prosekii]|uniref:Uncharacterized protein n=1 Tax=Pseudomonas prosekii TaxID=1148509 RepID=A0A1H1VTJ4_9PSED|nr:hypothetical protein SAMN05216222_2515 [Pseudomonas prosekii]
MHLNSAYRYSCLNFDQYTPYKQLTGLSQYK